MAERRRNVLWAMLMSLILALSAATSAQVVEKTTVLEDSTRQNPPKPVIFSIGYTWKAGPADDWNFPNSRRFLSIGATAQIPLAPHFYLGPCLDYLSNKSFDPTFIWGAELVGDLGVMPSVRVQMGAGLEASTAGRFSARLVYEPQSKIGCTLEFVLWPGLNNPRDDFGVVRFGVVF
jgi:hypothetical protein